MRERGGGRREREGGKGEEGEWRRERGGGRGEEGATYTILRKYMI